MVKLFEQLKNAAICPVSVQSLKVFTGNKHIQFGSPEIISSRVNKVE